MREVPSTPASLVPLAPDITEPIGATPTEIVITDSSGSGPRVAHPAEELGAAPVAILPGATGSDGELSADAVEIVTTSPEDAPVATKPASASADPPPREGIPTVSVPVTVPITGPILPSSLATTEPREVEPEAVEMVDSSERLGTATATPVPPTKPRPASPPPVRPESPGATPPPIPPEVAAAHLAGAPPTASASRASTPPTPEVAALLGEIHTPGAPGEQIPEALARRSLQKRSKPWYEEIFDEDYLRTLPFSTPAQTQREANFIRESLAPPKAGEILDVGCGYGRHALELAQQGYRVTGLDLSLPLLIRAADEAQRRGFSVNFVHADMREMTFTGQFDAAYCVLSSFGYFDEETNLKVATGICRALKPGGRFLLDILNRDYIVGDLPSRVWWEGDGCVVLEEVDFNFHTSRVVVRRSVVFGNGRQSEQEISVRAYSLHELGKLLRQAGLRVLQVSGGLATRSRFFGASSRNIIALCERPPD